MQENYKDKQLQITYVPTSVERKVLRSRIEEVHFKTLNSLDPTERDGQVATGRAFASGTCNKCIVNKFKEISIAELYFGY